MANFSAIFALLLAGCSIQSANSQCALDAPLVQEIKNYEARVRRIVDTVLSGSFKGKLFNDTAEFVDTVGSRVVGSQGLDKGIDYMLNWMSQQGFDDVHGEEIITPNWIRVNESLEMIEPRYQKLSILGYGRSVSTSGPLTAEIIVVRDYTELEQRADEVRGKIVVYDHTFVTYSYSTLYRNSGAIEAAKRGAVAVLVAAVSNAAMDLPHTGGMAYSSDETIPKIPMASISVDSARMLGRMHRRGNPIRLRLYMENVHPGNTVSRNTFGQLTGSVFPDEKVIISGHIDSWDVGQGAQDDGGAVVMAALVISLLKHLELTPRRSIQAVGWTSEENGLVGIQRYIDQHLDEINAGQIAAAFESDSGLFVPLGYDFAGTDLGACIVQEILKLFDAYNFTRFERGTRVGSDISYLSDRNVPTFNFVTDNEKYFWYHHAESDTMSAMDTDELDQCLAVYAASVYVIADLSQNLISRADTSDPNAANLTTSAVIFPIVSLLVTFMKYALYT
ncbi:carboxypeptidase Q-like [Bradysia coprophila]|uniref:carboxypeptidase Q-like n=1 Tax=Bradysia coprophila TaxID=38358 RepID=UPI00187D8406|nr:carboxypeptidase Q-like [Bradysia coprophila]